MTEQLHDPAGYQRALKAHWNSDAAIRQEFGAFSAFSAYCNAAAQGRAKIIGQGRPITQPPAVQGRPITQPPAVQGRPATRHRQPPKAVGIATAIDQLDAIKTAILNQKSGRIATAIGRRQPPKAVGIATAIGCREVRL